MSILSDLQNKKLGLFELIAMGFDLYLKHFSSFFNLFCVTLLPFLIIGQIISLFPPSNLILWILFYLFFLFYLLVVFPVYTIASAVLTEGYILEKNPHINVVIKRILSRFLPFTSFNIRFGIIAYLRFLLLIIPGIIYAVNNGYYALAFILRDQRGKAAFQYSRSLVQGNWWKVFFFYMLFYITSVGLQALIQKILSSVLINFPILVTLLSSTLASLVTLGVGISGVLLFLNLDFQKR